MVIPPCTDKHTCSIPDLLQGGVFKDRVTPELRDGEGLDTLIQGHVALLEQEVDDDDLVEEGEDGSKRD